MKLNKKKKKLQNYQITITRLFENQTRHIKTSQVIS